MTKVELVVRLMAIQAEVGEDYEIAHHRADDALIEFIADAAVAEAYNAIGKWYA